MSYFDDLCPRARQLTDLPLSRKRWATADRGVTLGEALRVSGNDFTRALAHFESSRAARTARVIESSRRLGKMFHATGAQRRERNDFLKAHDPGRFCDAIEWLYGWKVETCLAAAVSTGYDARKHG